MDKRMTTKPSRIANQSVHQPGNRSEDEVQAPQNEADVIKTNQEEELIAKDLETMNEPDRILSPLESKWLEDVSQRVSSVQEMICMTASGESFPVPVDHIQRLMREAKLGKLGARKAEALIRSIQKGVVLPGLKEFAQQDEDSARVLHRMSISHFGDALPRDGVGELDALLEEDEQERALEPELLERLKKTTGNVETYREALKKKWQLDFNAQSLDSENPDTSLFQEVGDGSFDLTSERPSESLEDCPAKMASCDERGLNQLIAKMSSEKRHWSGTVRKLQSNWRKLEQQSNRSTRNTRPIVTEGWFLDDLTSCRHGSHSKEDTLSGTSVYEMICQECGVTVNSDIIKGLKSTKCDLSHNSIGFRELHTFSRALAINLVIRELDLSDNNIDGEGAKVLVRGLLGLTETADASSQSKSKKEGTQNLDTVDFSPVKGAVSEESSERQGPDVKESSLAKEHIIRHRTLDTLIMSGNPLGLNGAQRLSECLDPNKVKHEFLTRLELSRCRIPDKGGYIIANALLSGNLRLTLLNLSHNEVANKTAAAFGSLLDKNRTLLSLNLSWNAIKQAGASALADGLRRNATLQELDISWNGIESAGVASFGEALQYNLCLKYLDLSSTRVGADACLVLAEGIKSNNVLETLLLNNNDFEESGAKHLMTALSSNSSLKYLGIQGANLSNAVGKATDKTSVQDFNPACPNGQYSLNLATPAARSVALQLCQLDQQSAFNLMKNIKLNGTVVVSVTEAHWPDDLPTRGTLALQFESQMEAQFVQTLTEKRVQTLLPQFEKKTITEEEKLRLVSLICRQYYISSDHAIRILNTFSIGDTKVSAALILFSRFTDAEEKLGSFLEALYERDESKFKEELGFHCSFRSRTPTGHYEFDFNQLVHRCLAARLMDVGRAEIPSPVFRNITYKTHTDPVVHLPLSIGPPEFLKSNIPRKGTLSLDYLSFNNAAKEASPLAIESVKELLPNVFRKQDPIRGEEQKFRNSKEAKGHGEMKLEAMHELKQELWQIHLTTEHALHIINSFKSSPERVEAAVGLFPRVTDLQNRWRLGYALNYMEQSCWMWRLGPDVAFELRHCTMHFFLDLSNSTHEEVAKKLVHSAVNGQENDSVSRIWNLRISGRKKSIQENANMWAALLTDSLTPKLEFDYFGPDSYQLFGKSLEEVQSMTTAEKLDLRSKQAKKKEYIRFQQLYGYWKSNIISSKTYQPPLWATLSELNKALVYKAPWLAAWDSTVRRSMYLESIEDRATSPLKQLFDQHTSDAETIEFAGIQDLFIHKFGFSKTEVLQFLRHSQTGSEASIDATKTALNFEQFLRIFMTETQLSMSHQDRT